LGRPRTAPGFFVKAPWTEDIRRAGEVRRLEAPLGDALSAATLTQVLLHGLSDGSDDVVMGVLRALRGDLGVIARLAYVATGWRPALRPQIRPAWARCSRGAA
jgi:hypothetical protein